MKRGVAATRRLAPVVSLALLSVGFGARCEKPQPIAPKRAAAPAVVRPNLLDIGRGGSVVSRTGEHFLEMSAVLTLDDNIGTLWSAPRNDPEQTIVYSLPARALIDEIGLRVPNTAEAAPQKIALEASLDGRQFAPLLKFTPGIVTETQTRPVKPTELRYLRLSTFGTSPFAQIRDIELRGRELERPANAALEGCWTVNGQKAHFVAQGSRTSGAIDERVPLLLDGGSDGRAYRFAWKQGAQLGLSIVTASPDGAHLSGIKWHTDVGKDHLGTTWFGERTRCSNTQASDGEVMAAFVRTTGFFPLYGLRFDERDELDENASDAVLQMMASMIRGTTNRRFALVAREFRGDAATNRKRAETRLASLGLALQRRGVDLLRIDVRPLGSEQPRVTPKTALEHALYNVVELQVGPPALGQ